MFDTTTLAICILALSYETAQFFYPILLFYYFQIIEHEKKNHIPKNNAHPWHSVDNQMNCFLMLLLHDHKSPVNIKKKKSKSE